MKGFTNLGAAAGLLGTGVSVDAVELTDPGSRARSKGIVVEVTDSRGDKTRSYVDYDEIVSLLGGLDYIAQATGRVTPLRDFEVSYRTKDDLVITTFSARKGALIGLDIGADTMLASVRTGPLAGSAAFYRLRQLAAMRSLLDRAKSTLDSLDRGGS